MVRVGAITLKKTLRIVSILTSVFCLTVLSGCSSSNSTSTPTVEVKPPIAKTISVTMNVDVEFDSMQKAQVKGETNLPNGTELMLQMGNDTNEYSAQDKVSVQNGHFLSNWFSNKGQGLSAGTYFVEVTSPTANVQPSAVESEIGDNGSNLKGQYVTDDATFGKMVDFKKEFTVKGQTASVTNSTPQNTFKVSQTPEKKTVTTTPPSVDVKKNANQDAIDKYEQQKSQIDLEIQQSKMKAMQLPQDSQEYRNELQKQIDLIKQKNVILNEEMKLLGGN